MSKIKVMSNITILAGSLFLTVSCKQTGSHGAEILDTSNQSDLSSENSIAFTCEWKKNIEARRSGEDTPELNLVVLSRHIKLSGTLTKDQSPIISQLNHSDVVTPVDPLTLEGIDIQTYDDLSHFSESKNIEVSGAGFYKIDVDSPTGYDAGGFWLAFKIPTTAGNPRFRSQFATLVGTRNLLLKDENRPENLGGSEIYWRNIDCRTTN